MITKFLSRMAARNLLVVLAIASPGAYAASFTCGTGGWTASTSASATYTTPVGSGNQIDSYNSQSVSSQTPGTCLTSATAAASGSGVSSAGTPNGADANSYVNLSSGSVGAYENSYGTFGNGSSLASNQTDSRFTDTIHFFIAGASANTVTVIPFSVALHGSESAGTSGEIFFQSTLGGCVFTHDTQGTLGPFDATSGCNSGTFTATSRTNDSFSGTILLTGQNPSTSVALRLFLTSHSPATLDLSHTGTFAFDLPTGVTFTSGSGAFLTDAAVTTPEPASFALAGLGLCGLAFLRRRKSER